MLDIFTIGLLAVVVSLWLRWRAKKFTVFKELGIPGPEPSIFFGNVVEMVKKGPLESQDEWIKKYGGVLGYYYGSWPTLLISDPECMKQVLIKDFAAFADRPSDFLAIESDNPDHPASHHMVNLKGKRWKEVRNMLTPTFTAGKLKQMIPMMNESALVLMRKLEEASGKGSRDVEISQFYQGLTMDAVGRSAFGVEMSVQDDPNHALLRFIKLLLNAHFSSVLNVIYVSFREFQFLLNPFRTLLFAIYGMGKNPANELFRLCGEVVKLRKNDPSSRRNDLLQTIIDARGSGEEISDQSLTADLQGQTSNEENNAQNNKTAASDKTLRKLTDTEITANAFVFFLAGYETTSSALSYLTHHLVNNPAVQEKVREEIFETVGKEGPVTYEDLSKLQYMDRTIMESLRMHPPVYSFENRVSSREVQVGEWKIPAGMTVQIPVTNLHYNPDNFEDPHTFNPDRFLPENRGKNHSVTWQPFGVGPRNCVGMRFALLEIKLTLIKILRKYSLEISEKTEVGGLKLEAKLGIVHPANGIHLRVVPL